MKPTIKTRTRAISRRLCLRGAGSIALALPLLEAMERRGRAAAAVKRFVAFFSPNGTIDDAWRPSGSDSSFQLSRILAPLEPFKSKLLILQGIDNAAGSAGPADDHGRGISSLLTGVPMASGSIGLAQPSGFPKGISVDQDIANKIGAATRFKSLEFGVKTGSGTPLNYMCYSAPGQPLPPQQSAATAFARIFSGPLPTGGGGSAPTATDPAAKAAMDRLWAQRKSVLDTVNEDFVDLIARVGADDKHKLEAHFTTLRDLEARVLDRSIATGAAAASTKSCQKPAEPADSDFPSAGKAHMDLMAMAFMCDLTRVASLQWNNAAGGQSFTWLGISGGHHPLSHAGDGDANARESLIKINVWYAQQFAYLLDKLDKVPEGNGTMLDNTVVFWGNELHKGNGHTHADMPYVLAGSGGGYFRTGRYLSYGPVNRSYLAPGNGTNHNDLLVALENAMGIETTSFGDAKYCKGPLKNLT